MHRFDAEHKDTLIHELQTKIARLHEEREVRVWRVGQRGQ